MLMDMIFKKFMLIFIQTNYPISFMGKKQDKNDHLNPMPGPCQPCLSTITKRIFVWKKIEKIFSILNRKGSEEMKWNIFCFRQEPRWSLPWAGTFLKVSPAQRYLERCDMLKDQLLPGGFPMAKGSQGYGHWREQTKGLCSSLRPSRV